MNNIFEKELEQHKFGKYKHKTKDIEVTPIKNLTEKIEEVNGKMIDFNSRLSALE